MDTLAQAHDVKFAMLYERRAPDIPKNWIKLGELHLSRMKMAVRDSIVTFYALDESQIPSMLAQIDRFVPTLPRGVKFKRTSEALHRVGHANSE